MNDSDLKVALMNGDDVEAVFELAAAVGLARWMRSDYLSEIKKTDIVSLTVKRGEKLAAFIIARLIINKDMPESLLGKSIGEPKRDADEGTPKKPSRLKEGAPIVCNCICEAEIYCIAVDEREQSKGIGRLLMEKLMEYQAGYRQTIIWLEVRKSNRRAIGFYRKQLFEEAYERKNYYTHPTENAVVMRRETVDGNRLKRSNE